MNMADTFNNLFEQECARQRAKMQWKNSEPLRYCHQAHIGETTVSWHGVVTSCCVLREILLPTYFPERAMPITSENVIGAALLGCLCSESLNPSTLKMIIASFRLLHNNAERMRLFCGGHSTCECMWRRARCHEAAAQWSLRVGDGECLPGDCPFPATCWATMFDVAGVPKRDWSQACSHGDVLPVVPPKFVQFPSVNTDWRWESMQIRWFPAGMLGECSSLPQPMESVNSNTTAKLDDTDSDAMSEHEIPERSSPVFAGSLPVNGGPAAGQRANVDQQTIDDRIQKQQRKKRLRQRRRERDRQLEDNLLNQQQQANESVRVASLTTTLTSDRALSQVAQVIAATTGEAIHVIPPLEAWSATREGHCPDFPATASLICIVAFDGPTEQGHFYNLWWSPSEKTLMVRDSAPRPRHRRPTLSWCALLRPRKVTLQPLPSVESNDCAVAVLKDIAAVAKVRLPPISVAAVAAWEHGGCPTAEFVSDLTIACTNCLLNPCCCGGFVHDNPFLEAACDPSTAAAAAVAFQLLAETAVIASAAAVDRERQLLHLAFAPEASHHEPTLRGGGSAAADRRVLSQSEYLRLFREAGGVKELVGKTAHIVFREHGTLECTEWYGTVTSAGGSERSPELKVEYHSSPHGPLVADDDVTIVTERGTLPPKPTDLRMLDIVFLEFLEHPTELVTQVGGPAASDSDSDCDERSAQALPTSALRQVDPYAHVADTPHDFDYELWPNEPPELPTLSTAGPFFTRVTGADFLAFGLLDEDAVRKRCPDVVYASVTASVRRNHLADLKLFRSFLEARPNALPLPLDVLLVHHLQVQRSERSWRWATLSRVAASLVGAFVSLPIYSNGPSLNPTRWPHFKALLQTAKRLGVHQGSHEPIAATGADVRGAYATIKDERVRVILLLAWFTAARPCDVIQLKKSHVVFVSDKRIRVHFERGKTVNAIGAYSIHTQIDDDVSFNAVKQYVEKAKPGFLFPVSSGYQRSLLISQLRQGLRAVRPELEARSLRRGTLQALAAAGASEETLLTFSRHKTVDNLRLYLGHERIPHQAQQQGIQLAQTLRLHGGGDYVKVNDWISIAADGDVMVSTERSPDVRDATVDRSKYPIHAKEVTRVPIDLSVIDQMANAAPSDVRDAWFEDRQWLDDVAGIRSSVPWNGVVRKSTLTPSEVGRLLDLNNCTRVLPGEEHNIRQTIFVFKTPEDAKARNRVIKWPIDDNSYFGPAYVRNRGNTTRRRARTAVLHAEGAIALDVQAMFDGILISDRLSWCQVFAVGKKLYRNLRLPMGGRFSTQIATSLVKVLIGTVPPGVRVDYATDNVRFSGKRDEVIAATLAFVRRCAEAKVFLNEIDVSTATLTDVAALWKTTESDFVGEVADFTNRTIKCRQRHVDKLRSLFAATFQPGCKNSALFGLYAMLLYMSETLGIRLDSFYTVRAFYSQLARQLAKQYPLWDAPATDFPPTRPLAAWVSLALLNKPASLVPTSPPHSVLIGDASAAGYAGILCARARDGTESYTLIQQPWDSDTLAAIDVQQSTVSEPEATVRLLDAARRLAPPGPILYVTDHQPFVTATKKGYSISPFYNRCVSRLNDRHPECELFFSPGATNPADKFSRFEAFELTSEDREASAALVRHALDANVGRCYRIVGAGRGDAAPPKGS